MVSYYHFYTQIFLKSALASAGAAGHNILMLMVAGTRGEDPRLHQGTEKAEGARLGNGALWAPPNTPRLLPPAQHTSAGC